MLKRFRFLVICAAVLLLFTGCMTTVDKMYRVPKRSEAYNDLQSAIDTAMSELSYCAPLAGENQQTVQMADLDGDGTQEYLLFAKSNEDRPLRILVFRDVDGTFVNTDTVECNGSFFDMVEYVDMDRNPGLEIVVGRQLSDQVIRAASVYSFSNGELEQLVTVNYTKFLTADFDGDNLAELFLLRPGQTETDNGVAEVYSMKTGTIGRYNEVSMSQPVDKLKRILVGKLDGGMTAVYTASAVGDSALVTDVFSLIDGILKNVTFSNETGTSVKTMRNYYVYADDIDNDTEVELPYLIPMRPLDDTTSTDTHQLIRWYAMTPDGAEVDKMYTYHNFVGGWYLQLQSDWAPRLVVSSSGYTYEFFIWDDTYKSSQKIMTLYVLTGQNRDIQGQSEDRFTLHKTDSVVYAASLEACAAEYGFDQESVTYSFRLIQQDWKTGET